MTTYKITKLGVLEPLSDPNTIEIVSEGTKMRLVCTINNGKREVSLYNDGVFLHHFQYAHIDYYAWAFTTMYNRLVSRTGEFESQLVTPRQVESEPAVQIEYDDDINEGARISTIIGSRVYQVELGTRAMQATLAFTDAFGPMITINASVDTTCSVEVRFRDQVKGFRLSQTFVDLVPCVEVFAGNGYLTQLSDYEVCAVIQLLDSVHSLVSSTPGDVKSGG